MKLRHSGLLFIAFLGCANIRTDQQVTPELRERIVRLVAKLGPGNIQTHFNPKGWGEGSDANIAAGELARIGVPVVGFVLPVLKDDQEWRRGLSLEVLEHVLDRRAVPPACEVLRNDPAYGVRGRAAELLGLLEDRRATDALIVGLRDKEAYVRSKSAEALGLVRDPRSVSALIRLIGTNDDYSVIESWNPVMDAIEALVKIGDPAIPALRSALSARDEYTRSHAAVVLGRLRDGASADRLAQMLRDPSQYVVARAAVALGRLHDKRVTATAVNLLQSKIPEVGQMGIDALGWVDDPAAVEQLAMLMGKVGVSRHALAHALGRHDDPRALEALLRMASEGDYERAYAVEALVGFKDERIDPFLIAAAKCSDNYVRDRAIETLGARRSTAALPTLVETLEHPPAKDYMIQDVVAEAIGRIDRARLLQLLASESGSARHAVIRGLAKAGGVEDIAKITPFLNDVDMRPSVIYAIGELKPPNGLALVTPYLEDKQPYSRAAAIRVVDELQVAERTARLRANKGN